MRVLITIVFLLFSALTTDVFAQTYDPMFGGSGQADSTGQSPTPQSSNPYPEGTQTAPTPQSQNPYPEQNTQTSPTPQSQSPYPEDLDSGGSAPGAVSAPATQAQRPSQMFKALAGVPGITNFQNLTLAGLLNALYRILIVIGALIAVLKITVAGLKYMGSDNFGSKASAKEDITAALMGLLILLGTVLIITTVMGNVNLNAFQQAPQINYPQQAPPALTPQVLPPNTIALVAHRGCAQSTGAGCQSGGVPTIAGNAVGCTPPNTVVPGQNTFRYMTQSQCSQASMFQGANDTGNINKLIRDGRTIYGFHEVRSGQTQPTSESLLEACRTAGGARVERTNTTYYYPFSIFAHYYGYTCTN